MMTYRISRNICIQHEEIFDLLVNYSTLHYIKILWIHKIHTHSTVLTRVTQI